MIKRLYLVSGNLIQPLDKNSENIAVDSATATQLTTLNIGDWCYLTLLEGNKLEVIRVTRMTSWFSVDRGQDDTCRFSFSTQAKIKYSLTKQEIEDASNIPPLNIYPDGFSAIEVSTGINSWQIKYTELNIQTIGGISWMNPDRYEIIITDNNGMFGCCDGSLTGAAYAGGVFFYLTSEIYAVLNIEGYVGINKSNKADIPPINIDTGNGWWLLAQPSIKQDWTSSSMAVNDWNLYGGAAVFNSNEVYVGQNMSLLDWQKYGGSKDFSTTDWASMDAYVLGMQLFGSAIVYNNAVDKYISPTVKLLDWALN